MIEIIWDEKFKRIYKKWSKKHPDLVERFRNKLELFVDDPFNPSSIKGNSGILPSFR
ncbi:MAG: hypothetical protein ACE5KE_09735 [Methanosarcinales archaeon]